VGEFEQTKHEEIHLERHECNSIGILFAAAKVQSAWILRAPNRYGQANPILHRSEKAEPRKCPITWNA